MTLPAEPLISVVAPARDEGAWVERTVEAILRTSEGWWIEVIVVDDGSSDGSCDFLREGRFPEARAVPGEGLGVATARNSGAAKAVGDVLIFLDAHVLPEPGWLEPLVGALRDPSVAIAGPAVRSIENPASIGYTHRFVNADLGCGWAPKKQDDPYDAPTIVGCGQAYRRALFEEIGGFDPGGVRWGVEDMEISLRAWFMGYRCVACPRSEIAHYFKSHEMRTFSISWEEYDVNLLRCVLIYFTDWRQAAILRSMRRRSNFERSMARVVSDGRFWERRDWLRKRLVHDDNWYVARFAEDLADFEARLCELAAEEEREMPSVPVVCTKCGMTNLGIQTKCLSCGTPLPASPNPSVSPPSAKPAGSENRCATCGAALRDGQKFCPGCGKPATAAAQPSAPAARKCQNPACGQTIPAGKSFCTACGTRQA